MEKRLLKYYERELTQLRELGDQFAHTYPKLAGRLSRAELAQADPYVERFLEGFGFMAARAHLKIDAQLPRFAQHMMELVFPHYLAPTPSMAIAQLLPDARQVNRANQRSLEDGARIRRGTALHAHTALRDVTPCEYRTAHDVELWPIELESAEYTTALHDCSSLLGRVQMPVKALLRIRLRAQAGLRFDRLPIQKLAVFLRGGDEISARLYEQLVTSACGLWLRWGPHPTRDVAIATEPQPIRALGFAEDEALLPVSARTFQGFRLLSEYFAMPSRYDFVELRGLTQGMARCTSDCVELLVPLSRVDPTLEGAVDAARLCLFSTPVINLFPRACDRLPMPSRHHDLHVVVDRTRPLDFEVHSVTQVALHDCENGAELAYAPMNARNQRGGAPGREACYSLQRRARAASLSRRQYGSRTPYVGSEVFLTLSHPQGHVVVDGRRQLAVHALCTNRDVPLLLGLGRGGNDFRLSCSAPVAGIRCVAGPTPPRSTPAEDTLAARLVSHLALNYLSLCQQSSGAGRLRELLTLYAHLGDPNLQRQVEGVRAVQATPITRRAPGTGPHAWARGTEVSLSCDERAFSGHGVFTLASVLAAFFAKHAGINSFTETVLSTEERGEVHRWPMTAGLQHRS